MRLVGLWTVQTFITSWSYVDIILPLYPGCGVAHDGDVDGASTVLEVSYKVKMTLNIAVADKFMIQQSWGVRFKVKNTVTMNENWFKLPHYWIYLCKYLLPKLLMTMTPQYTIINKRCPLLHKCRLSATEASMLNTVLIKMTIYSSGIPTWFLLAGRGGTLLLRGLGVSCPKCTEGLGVWARD